MRGGRGVLQRRRRRRLLRPLRLLPLRLLPPLLLPPPQAGGVLLPLLQAAEVAEGAPRGEEESSGAPHPPVGAVAQAPFWWPQQR